MLPDVWQTVQRLLLICAFKDEDVAMRIAPALQRLCQLLPNADMHFLMLQENGYNLVACGGQSTAFLKKILFIPIHDYLLLIGTLRECAFDAAMIFTAPFQSPFSFAYLCYLANIPIRLGQSLEFGGGVLSHCIKPPIEPVSLTKYHLHLLEAAGFVNVLPPETTQLSSASSHTN